MFEVQVPKAKKDSGLFFLTHSAEWFYSMVCSGFSKKHTQYNDLSFGLHMLKAYNAVKKFET